MDKKAEHQEFSPTEKQALLMRSFIRHFPTKEYREPEHPPERIKSLHDALDTFIEDQAIPIEDVLDMVGSIQHILERPWFYDKQRLENAIGVVSPFWKPLLEKGFAEEDLAWKPPVPKKA